MAGSVSCGHLRQFGEGLGRERQAPRAGKTGHGVARCRDRPRPAGEHMALIEERMAVAEREFLGELRAHHRLLQREARRDGAPRPLLADEAPGGIGRPAMRRRARLDIAGTERGAEEIAGKVFQVRLDLRIVRDRRIVDPRRGVQRGKRAAAGLNREAADMADGEIDGECDARRRDTMESVCHEVVLRPNRSARSPSRKQGRLESEGQALVAAGRRCYPLAARAGIAQLVEHLICNQGVAGSNPAAGTTT